MQIHAFARWALLGPTRAKRDFPGVLTAGTLECTHRAFQVRLITQSNADAKKLALAAMKGADAARKKLAVKYLVHGPSGLQSFGEGSYLYGMSFTTSYSERSGMPIVPKPPEGVTAADIRPLMSSADRETAASAAYLLALLGESEGVEPLLQYWRQREASSDQWRKLVYRAIAVIDEPNIRSGSARSKRW
jgi:hypothetical protein